LLKSELLRVLQQEIRRHDFSTFIDQPPSMAQGGKGVCVPGCPACKKHINTMNQFVQHLAVDVLPKIIGILNWSPLALPGTTPTVNPVLFNREHLIR
jgi:hypothetical protein